jgi:hypothetical protein
MAPLTVYLLARDEVPSSNALKVPVAAQAKVPITGMLAMERFDVLKIAVDAYRRPGAGDTFGRVMQDDRLARWHPIRARSWIVLPLSVAHASESIPVARRCYLPGQLRVPRRATRGTLSRTSATAWSACPSYTRRAEDATRVAETDCPSQLNSRIDLVLLAEASDCYDQLRGSCRLASRRSGAVPRS